MPRAPWIAMMCPLTACSFLTAAGDGGTASIHKKHAWVDVGGMAVAEVACFIGIVAWNGPDAFAPVQDDPTSWSPGERDSTIAKGQTAATLGCTGAVIFMASAIFGHHYAGQNDGDDTNSGGWDPQAAAAVGAAFANGFLGARQQTTYTPPVYTAPVYTPPLVRATPLGRACTSDFGCGAGFACVKPNYSGQGTCLKSVDDVGVPTFDGPSLDSVGPKLPDPHDCDFDTDCPAGFRCEPKSGACVR
jgi:hypothetical protein